jgi:hypothetical protein
MKTLWVFGALLVLLSCARDKDSQNEQTDVVDLLPLDNEISGWVRSSTMSTAENAQQLWDLINGEGQVYIDNGFVKCAFQSYSGEISGSTVELHLRVFDMGNAGNAESVYDAVGVGSETPWTDDGEGAESRIDESLLYAYKVDFWHDRFYVSVVIEEKSDAALAIAKLFALNVSDAILRSHSVTGVLR